MFNSILPYQNQKFGIRRKRENLDQSKYGPVYKSDSVLRYGILILVTPLLALPLYGRISPLAYLKQHLINQPPT